MPQKGHARILALYLILPYFQHTITILYNLLLEKASQNPPPKKRYGSFRISLQTHRISAGQKTLDKSSGFSYENSHPSLIFSSYHNGLFAILSFIKSKVLSFLKNFFLTSKTRSLMISHRFYDIQKLYLINYRLKTS